MRSQWKSSHELERLQALKLQKLVRHAYTRVPYYRRLFDSVSIRPQDVRELRDLRHLPLTSKKEMNEMSLPEKMAAGIHPDRCRTCATSGTTGIPLKIYHTPADATVMSLGWARAFLSRGMRPWDKIGAFIGQKDVREKRSWYEYLGIWRKREISNWDSPEIWIKALREWKPPVLIGYEMSLTMLSEAVLKSKANGISPKMIFHSSTILEDSRRHYIESALQTRIIDVYGSDEAGCIAWECGECSAYHVSSDMVIVEIVNNGEPVSPGEEGQIVITNLNSHAMPFIRYLQGDIGRFSVKEPLCKRGLPLMERVLGREDDFIFLKNGRKVSSQPFYHCIDPVPGIRRWKLRQEEIDKICVKVEPGAGFSEHTTETIANNIRRLVGGEAEVFVSAGAITVDPSVKFRAVRSEIGKIP
jgi:phenylacetate-CoA ligase